MNTIHHTFGDLHLKNVGTISRSRKKQAFFSFCCSDCFDENRELLAALCQFRLKLLHRKLVFPFLLTILDPPGVSFSRETPRKI